MHSADRVKNNLGIVSKEQNEGNLCLQDKAAKVKVKIPSGYCFMYVNVSMIVTFTHVQPE